MTDIEQNTDLVIPASPSGDGAQARNRPPVAGVAANPAPPTEKRAKSPVPRAVILPVLLIVVLAVGVLVYRYLEDQALYVSTDNALVTGAMIQVGSPNAGQIASVALDIGAPVTRNQEVASVILPSSLGTTATGTPKLSFRGTDDQQVSVRSPVDGIVVARVGNPGDTVAPGQPILTVVDPTQLWVQAQVQETKIGRVREGQPVIVTVDALGRSLPGKVVAVGRATAATFSLLPQGDSSGSFTKVTQVVPVKIATDYGQQPLVLGSSVEVKIRVQE